MARVWSVLWGRGLGRILAWLLIAPIKVYQLVLSPLLGPRCRYYPSCSHFAVGALSTHGPVKGLVLGTWRILRCNPWSGGGIDPVPARGQWRPDVHPDGTPRVRGVTPEPGAGVGQSAASAPRENHDRLDHGSAHFSTGV